MDYPEPSRARRIRDKQRMKAKARRIWKHIADLYPVGKRQAYLKANEKLADHLAHCNRWCCNKRRKHEGPPIQEIREAMRADETISA